MYEEQLIPFIQQTDVPEVFINDTIMLPQFRRYAPYKENLHGRQKKISETQKAGAGV